MICELRKDEIACVAGGLDFTGRRVSTNVEFREQVGPFIVTTDYQGQIIKIEWA